MLALAGMSAAALVAILAFGPRPDEPAAPPERGAPAGGGDAEAAGEAGEPPADAEGRATAAQSAREARAAQARAASEAEAERERQLVEQARLALERFQQRARNPDAHQRRVLERIFEPLEEASARYAKHESLEDSRWFGEDQESNQASIDELLDQAIGVLELSEIAETRRELREARARIKELAGQRARDREARLSSRPKGDISKLRQPFVDSTEDIDARIEAATHEIDGLEQRMVLLEQEFINALREIGVDVDRNTAQSLLGTVSGDDFVEMCIAFDNIRIVTVQLQDLTEQAGESLDVARRYYGSYVVLVRIMDRIQKQFVERIESEQLPKLAGFEERAQRNIAQAKKNLLAGGDPQVAEQNIRSNELTLEATDFYRRFLQEQAASVRAQNEALQPRLRDALNTYDTVRLSSQVAELIREGQRNFSALLELDVPELRGFENAELEAEFRRLTDELIRP